MPVVSDFLMTGDKHDLPGDEATRRHDIEKAKALRQEARAGGLRFEAAKWFG